MNNVASYGSENVSDEDVFMTDEPEQLLLLLDTMRHPAVGIFDFCRFRG